MRLLNFSIRAALIGANPLRTSALRTALLLVALAALTACQGTPKELAPVPKAVFAKMEQLAMDSGAPIYIRIFKQTSELEVWKQKRDGDYALLKTYQICKWSGELGPKVAEGDRQAPEGFYTVTPGQMNPNSSYYLSFNIGYPNTFDSSLGRTGSNLMVHGACSSAGCYSMTDENAGEIFALARDAFKGGQRAFQVHAFPFRMTAQAMAQQVGNRNFAFWQMLKEGYDHFEVTHRVPSVNVCDRRYVFDAESGGVRFDARAACPAFKVPEPIRVAVAARQAEDDMIFASLAPGKSLLPAPTAKAGPGIGLRLVSGTPAPGTTGALSVKQDRPPNAVPAAMPPQGTFGPAPKTQTSIFDSGFSLPRSGT